MWCVFGLCVMKSRLGCLYYLFTIWKVEEEKEVVTSAKCKTAVHDLGPVKISVTHDSCTAFHTVY